MDIPLNNSASDESRLSVLDGSNVSYRCNNCYGFSQRDGCWLVAVPSHECSVTFIGLLLRLFVRTHHKRVVFQNQQCHFFDTVTYLQFIV